MTGTNPVARGVLWDMDGVIADTNVFHFQSWRETLPEFGVEMSEQDHQNTFGMNNKKILTILMGAEPDAQLLKEVSDRKEKAFREIAREKVTPMPGVLDWLERFSMWGSKQAIASSAPIENINTLVESMGLGGYFQAMVSGFALPAKPDPAVYLEAAQRIDTLPANCIVIEDAIVGVQGAHSAGMAAIGIATTHDARALELAEIVVERMEALDAQAVRTLMGL